MTLSPNQQFRPAPTATSEQLDTVDSNRPNPMAPEVTTIADVELTISHYGWLTYRDHKGIARRVEMTNDIQTLLDTLVQGSGEVPVETVKKKKKTTLALPATNLRFAGEGGVQRPLLQGEVKPDNWGDDVPLG